MKTNAPKILRSLEVRWFSSGPESTEWDEWFCRRFAGPSAHAPPGTCLWKTEGRREDEYLVLPDNDYASIKLREYPARTADGTPTLNIEHKLREVELGDCELAKEVHGRLEGWCKWSQQLPVSRDDFFRVSGIPATVWKRVPKARKLAKFRSDDFAVSLVDPGTPVEQVPAGCNVEFTQVELPGKSWGSLCFETFGDLTFPQLQRILSKVVAETFGASSLRSLNLERSLGYPAWLAGLLHAV